MCLDLCKAGSVDESDDEDVALMDDNLKDEDENCGGEAGGGRDLKERKDKGLDNEEGW